MHGCHIALLLLYSYSFLYISCFLQYIMKLKTEAGNIYLVNNFVYFQNPIDNFIYSAIIQVY